MKDSTRKNIETLSLVAVPLLVAVFGYVGQARIAEQTAAVQSAVAEQAVRKDFVQMAIGILSKPPSSEDDRRLREWALKVLDKNSPIPFPSEVRADLLKRGIGDQGNRKKASDVFEGEFIPAPWNPGPKALPRSLVSPERWPPGDLEKWQELKAREQANFPIETPSP